VCLREYATATFSPREMQEDHRGTAGVHKTKRAGDAIKQTWAGACGSVRAGVYSTTALSYECTPTTGACPQSRARARTRIGPHLTASLQGGVTTGVGRRSSLCAHARQDEVRDHRHRDPTAVAAGQSGGGRSATPESAGESGRRRHCT
jgi:hypothetical protein